MPFEQEIHSALLAELRAQRQRRRSIWIVVDKTEILSEKPGQLIYRLTLAEEVRIATDSSLTIKLPGQGEAFEVQVLLADEQTLVVLSQQPLPQHMSFVKVEFDATFILKKLDEHLDQVLRFPPPPLCALLSRTLPPPNTSNDEGVGKSLLRFSGRINDAQHKSVVRMQSDTIHLLWGPPGTGKTHTLGISVAEHLRSGRTCLLLSTSNSAVANSSVRVLELRVLMRTKGFFEPEPRQTRSFNPTLRPGFWNGVLQIKLLESGKLNNG